MTAELIQRWDGLVLAVALCGLLVAWLQGSVQFERRSADQDARLKKSEASQRSAAVSLSERNRLLELTEEIAEIGHWRLNLADDSLYWSDGICRIHGVDPGNVPPLADAIAFYHPDDRAMVARHVEEARTDGKFYTFRARLIAEDGTVKQVEARGLPEFGRDGKPIALYGMLADRTKEHGLREEALEERDRANALGKAKFDFLTRLSHQLREPANSIVGFTDLMLAEASDPEIARPIELVSHSARQMAGILDDVLDLSQIERGSLRLETTPADPGQLLRETVESYRERAAAKGLTLAVRIGDGVPQMIWIDPRRLRQIAENLVSNAVKYTDSGFVTASLRRNGDQLEIAVRDTGPGIAKEDQPAVFSDFERVENTATLREGGVGLGIPISQRLARMLGGTLALESDPGSGSTFTLSIPFRECTQASNQAPAPASTPALASSPPQTASASNAALPLPKRVVAAPPPVAPPSGRSGRILLAEDHDINQMLIVEMAEALGLTVEVAGDGAIAVEMVARASDSGAPYTLVLMDLQMPNMTGLEATRYLRSKGHDAASLPIVAISANAFPDDIKACEDAGMQGHLAKPVTLERLRMALAPYVNMHSRAA